MYYYHLSLFIVQVSAGTKLLSTGEEQPVHTISIDGEDVERISRFK